MHDYKCWTTNSTDKAPNKKFIVVYENVPTKISFDDLHVDDHRELIKYLNGLTI